MRLISRAPLRISFGGDATDVPPYVDKHGGEVLSATINRYVYSLLESEEKGGFEDQSGFETIYGLDGEVKVYKAEELVAAAIEEFEATADPINIVLHSYAPAGSGFGATSTTVVSLTGLLARWKDKPLTEYELAKLAYKVEREDVGLLGGKQDAYMATMGGFNYIEFSPGDDNVIVNRLKIPQDIVNELEYRLLLCYSGTIERTTDILQDQMENYERYKDTLAELKGNCQDLKNALLLGNLDEFGTLLDTTWQLKKQLSPKISKPEIEKLYETAKSEGALGGRILGSGGGGYLLLYCDFRKKHLVAKRMEEMGGKIIDFNFEFRGLQTWQASY
jgi:D-glycero-alpha-D-manno-heptose-7-phosphate kinase